MAVRTFWKGYLKLSLVTCPVAMSPATSEEEKPSSTDIVEYRTKILKLGNRSWFSKQNSGLCLASCDSDGQGLSESSTHTTEPSNSAD